MKGAEEKEMLTIIEEQKKIINESTEAVLLLNDFRETYATKEYMDRAKKYGKEQKDKIKKTALLGIQGMKKILVQAYIKFSDNKNTKIFECIEEAKEYLVN
jgi:hypothetical protein